VIPGDLLQGGRGYATAVIDAIAARGVTNDICFEFFDVPPIEFLRHIDAKLPTWSFEVSPESHDRKVRHAMEGQAGYENEEMEALLREALKLRPTRIDVFFMIGLQHQTHASVMATVDYCEHLFQIGDPRLQCFISPMGPFLDPGSQIFEDPERFGYRKFAETVEEHRQLLVQPSWEHILNYETAVDDARKQLVDATYDAAERLNELKLRYGRISARRGGAVAAGIAGARPCGRASTPTCGRRRPGRDPEQLRGEIARLSQSTVSDKQELFWQRHLVSFRLAGILRAGRDLAWLTGGRTSERPRSSERAPRPRSASRGDARWAGLDAAEAREDAHGQQHDQVRSRRRDDGHEGGRGRGPGHQELAGDHGRRQVGEGAEVGSRARQEAYGGDEQRP
jgi:hypothetical protein